MSEDTKAPIVPSVAPKENATPPSPLLLPPSLTSMRLDGGNVLGDIDFAWMDSDDEKDKISAPPPSPNPSEATPLFSGQTLKR